MLWVAAKSLFEMRVDFLLRSKCHVFYRSECNVYHHFTFIVLVRLPLHYRRRPTHKLIWSHSHGSISCKPISFLWCIYCMVPIEWTTRLKQMPFAYIEQNRNVCKYPYQTMSYISVHCDFGICSLMGLSCLPNDVLRPMFICDILFIVCNNLTGFSLYEVLINWQWHQTSAPFRFKFWILKCTHCGSDDFHFQWPSKCKLTKKPIVLSKCLWLWNLINNIFHLIYRSIFYCCGFHIFRLLFYIRRICETRVCYLRNIRKTLAKKKIGEENAAAIFICFIDLFLV